MTAEYQIYVTGMYSSITCTSTRILYSSFILLLLYMDLDLTQSTLYERERRARHNSELWLSVALYLYVFVGKKYGRNGASVNSVRNRCYRRVKQQTAAVRLYQVTCTCMVLGRFKLDIGYSSSATSSGGLLDY